MILRRTFARDEWCADPFGAIAFGCTEGISGIDSLVAKRGLGLGARGISILWHTTSNSRLLQLNRLPSLPPHTLPHLSYFSSTPSLWLWFWFWTLRGPYLPDDGRSADDCEQEPVGGGGEARAEEAVDLDVHRGQVVGHCWGTS